MLLFLAPPALLANASRGKRSRTVVAPVCQRRVPKVKSSYYKNPSRAIEKGGGFYIPGLRGARLRVAVAGLVGTLLVLNHLAVSVSTPSLFRSELLAVIAALIVGGTAVVDILAERKEQDAIGQQAIASVVPDEQNVQSKVAVEQIGDEAALWAVQVARDLAAVTGVAVCRDGQVVFRNGVVTQASAGAAVQRVAKERKALYIDDANTLPSEITIPFVPNLASSVYLVPLADAVVCFCAAPKALGTTERMWLSQLARRIVK